MDRESAGRRLFLFLFRLRLFFALCLRLRRFAFALVSSLALAFLPAWHFGRGFGRFQLFGRLIRIEEEDWRSTFLSLTPSGPRNRSLVLEERNAISAIACGLFA
jgi:hypothetical protein